MTIWLAGSIFGFGLGFGIGLQNKWALTGLAANTAPANMDVEINFLLFMYSPMVPQPRTIPALPAPKCRYGTQITQIHTDKKKNFFGFKNNPENPENLCPILSFSW